jgi:hypothetical protein
VTKTQMSFYSKAQAQPFTGTLRKLTPHKKSKLVVRRVDEVNRRMRQYIANHVRDPNRDYMQMDSVPKPKEDTPFTFIDGTVVDTYKGP